MSGRRTHAELRAEGAAEERTACVEALRDKISEVQRLHGRGRLTASEARALVRRLDAVADGIAAGLHR